MSYKGLLWLGASKDMYKKETDQRITSVVQGQYINDIISTGESIYAVTSIYGVALRKESKYVITKNNRTLYLWYTTRRR